MDKEGAVEEDKPYIRNLSGGRRANMVPDECHAELVVPDPDGSFVRLLELEASTIPGTHISAGGPVVKVRTTGKTAHGSTPENGINAVSNMMLLLEPFMEGDSFQSNFIRFYRSRIGTDTDGSGIFGDICDEPSGKLVLNAGLLYMDTQHASMKLNIRYPVTCTGMQIQKLLAGAAADAGLTMHIDLNSEPLYEEKDSRVVQTLLSVYHSYCPDGSVPLAVGGGTYARSIPNSVAFGPVFPGKEELAHCPDEYISEEDLILSAKIYAGAMLRLAGREGC